MAVRKNKEDKFWDWFSNNHSQFLFVGQVDDLEKERLLNELFKNLQAYNKGLFFQIGGHPDGKQELIITPEGDRTLFPVTEKLVAAAPPLKDWNIIAFKQAMGFDFVIDYEGTSLDPRNMWFVELQSSDNPDFFGLRIGTYDFDPAKERSVLSATYLILDTILGERSCVLDVHYVEVVQLPIDPQENGFMPLVELPEYIAWAKRNKKENLS